MWILPSLDLKHGIGSTVGNFLSGKREREGGGGEKDWDRERKKEKERERES